MSRTIVIGDIHGALAALTQVMARAAITTSDKLIFLGDYVDGWPESAGVISLLQEIATRQPCIFIKGNHDVWCEEWLRDATENHTWLAHGGLETISSYSHFSPEAKKAHLHFFEEMPYYFIDDLRRLFIHAGFTSMQGPEKEFHRPFFSWDRSLWETALGLNPALPKWDLYYPKRLRLFEEIYIGHTPTIHYNSSIPMFAANVCNMDTGAGFHGRLSMMDINSKQVWQSDEVPTFYPNDMGRKLYR
ncbi:MAG: serine/threonine protein phosphatase [Chitinophagaceae bacterium]|nr:MAG: serine/threonine protein phosphatase [Chitinophagaceae bacterium]